MPGVNKCFGEGQAKIYNAVFSKENLSPLLKEKLSPSKKVAPSEEVGKGTNF